MSLFGFESLRRALLGGKDEGGPSGPIVLSSDSEEEPLQKKHRPEDPVENKSLKIDPKELESNLAKRAFANDALIDTFLKILFNKRLNEYHIYENRNLFGFPSPLFMGAILNHWHKSKDVDRLEKLKIEIKKHDTCYFVLNTNFLQEENSDLTKHWILMVTHKDIGGHFNVYYFDPLGVENDSKKKALEILNELLGKIGNNDSFKIEAPEQNDGWRCGYYVMRYVFFLTQSPDLFNQNMETVFPSDRFTKASIDKFRENILELVTLPEKEQLNHPIWNE